MALMQNVRNTLLGEFYKSERKNVKFVKNISFGVPSSAWRLRRPYLEVTANVGNRESVKIINGKKVNGVHIDGVSNLGKRNNNEAIVNDGCSLEEPNHEYLLGRFVENRFVYRQSFVIRSYEIGPDKTATMETLMNLLQETALNHVASSGVAGNGFGATREMSLRKLIWVVTRIHVQVDKYSSWGDLVEIDTWVDAAGKNGMRRDWVIRDYNTQKIITRATSTWVIMNRETRRLCKIPSEVKKEVQPFYLNRFAIPAEDTDSDKIQRLTADTAQIIRPGLAPRWSDMDANQHVNNVKYIGWILESVLMNVLEDYNLTSMTLEYRRECRQSNVLESLTSMKPIPPTTPQSTSSSSDTRQEHSSLLECTHLLRMETDDTEIVRARSIWTFKTDDDNIHI